jgi:multicomponent Na+:H+ antiporter subunit D
VCAIGIGTELALNGAAAHAFAHIIYKALLFMSAGVVVYRVGKSKCTDLGGLFRTMPLTTICGIIGALAISGFPMTSGFVTKTMISQAAATESLMFVYMALAAASAGVFLHAGIKFPWFVFFQKDSGLRPKDAPWNMAAAMVLFSAISILIGIFPETFYQSLPYAVDYEPYKASKVVFYLQLLLFSGLAFFLLLPLMQRTLTVSLDTDWIWRVALNKLAGMIATILAAITGVLSRISNGTLRALKLQAEARFSESPETERAGVFARAWEIGTTALWIAILLTAYVLFYLI